MSCSSSTPSKVSSIGSLLLSMLTTWSSKAGSSSLPSTHVAPLEISTSPPSTSTVISLHSARSPTRSSPSTLTTDSSSIRQPQQSSRSVTKTAAPVPGPRSPAHCPPLKSDSTLTSTSAIHSGQHPSRPNSPDSSVVPPINILGCRVELILAEKIITALQRGTANTRWRDFVDIAELARRDINSEDLAESIRRVAAFRQVQLSPLSNTLEGFGEHAQSRWAAWRRKQQLNDTPESFAALLDIVIAFSDQHLGRVQQ